MSTLEEIVALFGGQSSGNGFKARCPVHDDRTPSLSIGTGRNGIVLLHCHAGCSQGFTRGFCAAAWLHTQFRQSHGEVRYQVVREVTGDPTRPKKFYQRQPDGQGGWLPRIGQLEPLPYRC